MLANPNTQSHFQVALSDLKDRLQIHGAPTLSCFISYAWTPESKAFTKQLYEDLRRVGLNVNYDMDRNQAGTGIQNFTHEIQRVDRIIVCCTPHLHTRYESGVGVISEELPQIFAIQASWYCLQNSQYNNTET